MEYFKIEEYNGKYSVIPTATYLMTQSIVLPYDSNYTIYKLFDYEPEEFIRYLHNSFEAHIIILKEFPFLTFSFSKYSNASNFLEVINKRANES